MPYKQINKIQYKTNITHTIESWQTIVTDLDPVNELILTFLLISST